MRQIWVEKDIPPEQIIRKLRDELLTREICCSLWEAKVLVECWRREYNRVRPQSSLEYRLPAPEAVESPLLELAL